MYVCVRTMPVAFERNNLRPELVTWLVTSTNYLLYVKPAVSTDRGERSRVYCYGT